LKFSVSTFQTVSSFRPGTKIKYGPNPKQPGSKSFTRYAGYEKAKTVGEALKMGTKLADLCWELTRGHYKILGGERSEKEERRILGEKAYAKVENMIKCFNGPRGLNVKLDNPKAAQVLAKEEAWRESKLKKVREYVKTYKIKIENEDELKELGIHEAHELHAERKVCDFICTKRLKDAAKAGKKITMDEVQEAMELWGYAQNSGRLNVLPNGQKYEYSDTIGAIKQRCQGYGITPATKHYPNFVKLLCKWLTDSNFEAKFGCEFKCSAINLNANYAASRHRDGGNTGPSIIVAVGDFKGGELYSFPKDTQRPRVKVEHLKKEDAVKHNINRSPLIFDGLRAHEVNAFTGHRYSIVFFAASGFQKIKPEHQKYLKSLGMPFPTAQAVTKLQAATKRLVEDKATKNPMKVKKHAFSKSGRK